jgi:hypothetical protein
MSFFADCHLFDCRLQEINHRRRAAEENAGDGIGCGTALSQNFFGVIRPVLFNLPGMATGFPIDRDSIQEYQGILSILVYSSHSERRRR